MSLGAWFHLWHLTLAGLIVTASLIAPQFLYFYIGFLVGLKVLHAILSLVMLTFWEHDCDARCHICRRKLS